MSELSLYNFMVWISFPLATVVFIVLLFISAPYGRHERKGWGPSTSNRLGWLVMESPSVLIFALLFWLGEAPKNAPILVFFLLWEAHYIHRSLIYPFMIADGKKIMPFVIVLMAFLFNSGNAYINGAYLFSLSGGYPESWLRSPKMVIGLVVFLIGFITNRWADRVLQGLREPGSQAYRIPYGGLYRWVSCPNYLGELVEWIGWAIATWSLPGLAFAVWTFANLAPRARAHHSWYHQYFSNYPKKRKALIPGIW